MHPYYKAILEAAAELERQRAEAHASFEEATEEYKLLRDAAAELVEACDAMGEQDCTPELMSREERAREALRKILEGSQ